jgi:hypothetical protein
VREILPFIEGPGIVDVLVHLTFGDAWLGAAETREITTQTMNKPVIFGE